MEWKKQFWVQQAVKKVMLPAFWDMKRPITIDFLEKGAIVKKATLSAKLPLSIEYGFMKPSDEMDCILQLVKINL